MPNFNCLVHINLLDLKPNPMKVRRLPLIISISSLLVLSSFIAFYPTGAPPAKTGSPGDGSNCTECHGGTPTSVTGWITSNIPASGYTPGQSYQITATNQITGSGKFGFEVSPQNVAGDLLGTLTAGANNQLVGNNKYVTHVSANTSVSSWTFTWTAPPAGTGQVTFYGAFARNKPGPVRLSTLVVNEQTVSLPGAAGPISGPAEVCAGNSYSYSVGPISGATGYNWTVPAGASILSGQGTTNVSVSFGSNASSGNVSVFGSNQAGNGAPSHLAVAVGSVPAQLPEPAGPSIVDLAEENFSIYSTSGSTNADSYLWELTPVDAGILNPDGMNATVNWNPLFSGIAGVSVKAINACGDGEWSTVKQTNVINTTGTGDPVAKNTLIIYPNPSSGHFTLEPGLGTGIVTMQIVDASGKPVCLKQVPGNQPTILNLSLRSGIYMLTVSNDQRTLKEKLFIR